MVVESHAVSYHQLWLLLRFPSSPIWNVQLDPSWLGSFSNQKETCAVSIYSVLYWNRTLGLWQRRWSEECGTWNITNAWLLQPLKSWDRWLLSHPRRWVDLLDKTRNVRYNAARKTVRFKGPFIWRSLSLAGESLLTEKTSKNSLIKNGEIRNHKVDSGTTAGWTWMESHGLWR